MFARPSAWLLAVLPVLVSCISAERLSAPTISLSPLDPTTTDDLVVSLVKESTGSEKKINYEYIWTVDGLLRSDLSEATVPAVETTKGETWTVLVTATTGDVEGLGVESSVVIINTAPSVTLEIEDADPTSIDDLVAIANIEDPDGDEPALTWSWTVDGAETSEDKDTVAAESTSKGEEWEASLLVSDGEAEVSPEPVAVAVLNALPTVTEVLVEPTEAYETSVLTASVTTDDADGDAVSVVWAWSVNGTAVPDATSTTLEGTAFNKHDSVVATATPSDDEAEGVGVDADSVAILNTAPSITGVALDPTFFYEASTVTCTPSGWTDVDGDTEAYLFAWEINGTVISETSETLDGTSFSKSDIVSCTATPSDGEVSGDAQTSATMSVLNTPPTISSATLSTTTPQEGDSITVTVSGAADDDGDTVSYQYAWYVDSAFVAATSELTSSSFSKGQSIWVEVTPHDGADGGVAVTSDTAIAQNTAPVLASATLTPDPVAYSGTLSCLAGTASDADSDIVTYAYSWTVAGAPLTATDATLDNTWFLSGSSVSCSITPFDGEDLGTAVPSNTVTVNHPPTVGNVVISPSAPTAADTITCQHDTPTDADGDSVSVAYAWTIGTVAATSTSSTLGAAVQRDQVVACTVTPSDPYESGTGGTASVTVANTPPEVSSVTLSPSAPTTDSTVTANVAVSDLDGDTVSLAYAFSVGTSLTQNSASNQLDGSAHFARGDEISVIVTPQDGQNQGAAYTGATPVTVVNSPPTAPGISITPTDPEADIDPLTCSVDTPSTDADTVEKGDTVQYYFDWIDPTGSVVQSVGPTTATSNVISASNVGAGPHGYWVCEVTPTDGYDDGPTASASVAVTESCATQPVSLVPALISNTSAQSSHSIVVSASSEHNSGNMGTWKAFNGTTSSQHDAWHSDARGSNTASHPEWIQVDFGANNSVLIAEASLTSRNHSEHRFSPITYQVEGSNDGASWTVLVDVVNDTSITAQAVTISHPVSPTVSYRYIRLNIDVVDPNSITSESSAALGELELIGCQN